MLARILSWSDVTGPFTCPREHDKALAQETEKHSCPWWHLRPPPSLGRHSHATHLTFLVGAKGTDTGHSHSHPENGDTRGRGSPQAGSGACPGQGWTERSGDAPCKAEGRTQVLGGYQLRQVKGSAGTRLREVKGQSSKGATSPEGASRWQGLRNYRKKVLLPATGAQSRQADLRGGQGTHQGPCRKG